jgi:hypothetical protein
MYIYPFFLSQSILMLTVLSYCTLIYWQHGYSWNIAYLKLNDNHDYKSIMLWRERCCNSSIKFIVLKMIGIEGVIRSCKSTDNTMVTRKSTKRQTTIYKTLHIRLKIEQARSSNGPPTSTFNKILIILELQGAWICSDTRHLIMFRPKNDIWIDSSLIISGRPFDLRRDLF